MKRALALIFLAACHHAPARHAAHADAQIAKVTRGAITDRVLLTGELQAASAIDLTVPRTRVTWELAIRWMAEDGSFVRAGDRVLEFDNTAVTADLETKRLAALEAQMTLETARHTSDMDIATKANELAQKQVALEKAKVLAAVPEDLLAKRDAQQRQLDVKHAEVDVQKAKEDLDAQKQEADYELKVKAIDLEKAKEAVDDTDAVIAALSIKAPRDGMVVIGQHPWEDNGRKYRATDTVQPGWAIISMPDPDAGMRVSAALSDVDDGRVSVGMVGHCTLDAYPAEPIDCTVAQLTPLARSTHEQSLRRAFSVELTLAKSDARMRPGMSVKVELARPGQNALVVPRGAVVLPDDPKGQVRVRLPGGGLRDVALGPCDPQRCAVTSGLAEGDAVLEGGGP